MTLRRIIAAVALLAPPILAQAQPVNGPYIAGAVGWNWHRPASELFLSSGNFGIISPVQANIHTDVGSTVLGSVGWSFAVGSPLRLRSEVEVSHRTNRVNRVELGGAPSVPSGRFSTKAVMANLLLDVARGPVVPYVGAGIGYAWQSVSNVGGHQDNFISFYDARFDGRQGAIAYQGIVGVAVPINILRGFAATAEYRYFASQAKVYSGKVTGDGLFGFFGGPTSISLPNRNQSLLFGMRYGF